MGCACSGKSVRVLYEWQRSELLVVVATGRCRLDCDSLLGHDEYSLSGPTRACGVSARDAHECVPASAHAHVHVLSCASGQGCASVHGACRPHVPRRERAHLLFGLNLLELSEHVVACEHLPKDGVLPTRDECMHELTRHLNVISTANTRVHGTCTSTHHLPAKGASGSETRAHAERECKRGR